MEERIEAVRKRIRSKKIGGFFSIDPVTNRYLSGFSGTSSGILITRRKAIFVTDSRYVEQAAKQVAPSYEHVQNKAGMVAELAALMKKLHLNSAGFEESRLTHEAVLILRKKARARLVPVGNWVGEMRMVKSEEEIALMKKAISVTDKVFSETIRSLQNGITELDLVQEVVAGNFRHGAEKEAFDTIALVGAKTSLPHGQPGKNRVQKGRLVLMDMGCVVRGYHSDLTRTFFFDRIPSAGVSKIYDAVARAQRRAIRAVRPGVPSREVDAVARDYLTDQGYGDYFGHGLGHGVGLEIHEGPTVSPRSRDVLQPGMVFSIEPGVYIPRKGGVRIEDLVLVTEDGAKVLTKAPKPRVVYGQ